MKLYSISYGSAYKSLIHFTDYINTNFGHPRGTLIRIMHYGRYNYMHWWFSDLTSNSHGFATPNSYFTAYEWYYIATTVDYKNGKY